MQGGPPHADSARHFSELRDNFGIFEGHPIRDSSEESCSPLSTIKLMHGPVREITVYVLWFDIFVSNRIVCLLVYQYIIYI